MILGQLTGNGVLRKALEDCKPHFLRVGLFSAVVNLLFLAPTIYMMQIYDRVVPTGGIGTLLWLTAILAAALATLSYVDSGRARLMVRAAMQLNSSLAREVLHRLMGNRDAAGQASQGRLALRELDTLRQSMTGPGVMALFDVPWIPIYLITAFILHPLLALLIVLGGGCLVVLAVINERVVREGNRSAGKMLAESHATTDTLLSKGELVRTLGMRGELVRRLHLSRSEALVTQASTALSATGFTASVKFVRMLLQSLALGLAAWLAIGGSISVGAIIAASVLLSRALQPIEQLVGAWGSLIASRQAIDTLETLFEARSDLDKQYFALPVPAGKLALSNVALRNLDGDGFVVRSVSFALEPGTMTGLIGPSGAGKTTIARIAVGAIKPDLGDVRIDGAEFGDWEGDALARHIGYLPQDYSLIGGTIAENISRLDPALESDADAVAAKVIEAARAAGVHDLVLRLPDGYGTRVGGANGFPLSGGQTQRIALARALYGQPVVLVLDEPSAALDAEGEQALMKSIDTARGWGASVLMIAHRPFVLSNADNLIVMNGGTIERAGPREEVLEALRQAAQVRPERPGPPGNKVVPMAAATRSTAP